MKKYDGVGMAKKHWDMLPEGTTLRVKNTDDGKIYQSTYEDARAAKITDEHPPYEMQVFVPLSAFKPYNG